MKWLCCQLGAREHYAIPRALYRLGMLGSLVTDVWVPPSSLLAKCCGHTSKLRERFHDELRDGPVKTFNSSLILFETLARARGLTGWTKIIARNRWFQRKVVSFLRSQLRKGAWLPRSFTLSTLNSVKERGSHAALRSQLSTAPILFLEPSCWSMFAEDYRELKIENADNIASRCFLFEKFVDDLLEQQPGAIRFNTRAANVAIHPHCHAKSILDPEFMASLAERLPGRKATVLDTACCGMAGAFGALAEKYDLSVQVAQRLLDAIENQVPGTEVIASGTSCRHQITDLTNLRPKHMAELLSEALL